MPEELIAADIRLEDLPSRFYHDESIFKSLLSVFNGWQYAAHKSELETNSICQSSTSNQLPESPQF